MKKSILLGTLGLVTMTSSSFGQGFIALDNYSTYGPLITYGPGVPANGISGALGTPGTGLLGGWTVGIYYALGTFSLTDPPGDGLPLAPLILATGAGSTVAVYTSAFNTPGEFSSALGLNVGGNAGDLITAEIVVYDTASGSYANAWYRGHSAPFTMPTVAGSSPTAAYTGDYMPAFSLPIPVPEPSNLILAGLAGLSLRMLRHKKA